MKWGNETFGALVSRLRKEKGFGLRELAKKLDISPTYLSKIENDKVDPPAAERIEALARLLSVNADELLAAAKRIPTDVSDMILNDPEKVTLLMRRFKNVSVEEIESSFEEKNRGKSGIKP